MRVVCAFLAGALVGVVLLAGIAVVVELSDGKNW